jgi:hypothetical protein
MSVRLERTKELGFKPMTPWESHERAKANNRLDKFYIVDTYMFEHL